MPGGSHAAALETACVAADGHAWHLIVRSPPRPRACLLWLPALGVAARHYIPFAEALAKEGIATCLHEWRGNGSSSWRASRMQDWGYREILELDIPASEAALPAPLGGLPRIVGGHSLGGQLACCRIALASGRTPRLWLVASGAPYWRAFPAPARWLLPMAYRFLPWLARHNGALPGRRLGFGGNEARGLIQDWARTALSGRYAVAGLGEDVDAALARSVPATDAVLLARDWLAPPSSLDYLLSRMPGAHATRTVLDDQALGGSADHFTWMKQPGVVARWLAVRLPG